MQYKIQYVVFFTLVCLALSCKTDPKADTAKKVPLVFQTLQGKTMGTTYTIKYLDSLNRDFQKKIDQLLVEVNDDVSTYIPTSFISRFNQSDTAMRYANLVDKNANQPVHFIANFEKCKEVFENSAGYFDPTLMPIVNYWGFGYTEKKAIEKSNPKTIDSLMQFVGFKKLSRRSDGDGWVYIEKSQPGIQLDFSAIAKGYGVDAVAALLEKNNIDNFYVEIGGELRVKGKSSSQRNWVIGINKPDVKAGIAEIQAKINLTNRAMATSGNYRNFHEVNGVIYAHTMNPKTGMPEKNTLLSASVFADDCMTADAYATACMAMGFEKSLDMINNLNEVDAYFLYSDGEGKVLSKSTNNTLQIQ